MNELIKISQNELNGADVNSVSARDLHGFLGSKRDFSTWIKDRLEYVEAMENTDFIRFHKKVEANNATQIEYIITLDLAKEFAMLERNDKGKEARRYFIECEKRLNSTFKAPKTMKEALLLALEQTEQIEALEAKIKADKPLVSFAKSIEASVDSILIGNYAKLLSDSEGVSIGQNRLFEWLRVSGYLITGGARHNVPFQRYIDNGYFEVSTQTYAGSTGAHQKFITKITGRGQIALAKKIVESFKKTA